MEDCGSKESSVDDLIPNRRLRGMASKFRDDHPKFFQRTAIVVQRTPPPAPIEEALPLKPQPAQQNVTQSAEPKPVAPVPRPSPAVPSLVRKASERMELTDAERLLQRAREARAEKSKPAAFDEQKQSIMPLISGDTLLTKPALSTTRPALLPHPTNRYNQ